MKKIKLFCGILIGLIIFSSCSQDDDTNTDSMSIIGTWKLLKQVFVCSTGSEETYVFTTCLQGELTFNSDGTVNDIYYCDDTGSPGEYVFEGTWSLSGENLTQILNGITFNTTFLEVTEDVLRIGYYYNEGDFPCDGNNFQSHRYQEYTRVE